MHASCWYLSPQEMTNSAGNIKAARHELLVVSEAPVQPYSDFFQL
jgi:hypothetical protein